jgi:multidrug efflux pump subunit AcrA (membrane-fusion protein)
MADKEPWEWLVINDSMALYRSSLAQLDRTEQLIEQSEKAVTESRALLERTRVSSA